MPFKEAEKKHPQNHTTATSMCHSVDGVPIVMYNEDFPFTQSILHRGL